MERTRPSPVTVESSALAPEPVARPSLRELLEVLRGPAVMRSDVEAFLQALGRPPVGDETPRARADLLLSLMQDARLRDYTGHNGRTVRAAAVQALVALGYPYALELPPEMLAHVRGEATVAPPLPPLKVPVAGLVTLGLALLTQVLFLKSLVPNELRWWGMQRGGGLHLVAAAVLPPVLVVLGGWRRWRWVRRGGVVLLGLVGLRYLRHLADKYVFDVLRGVEGPPEAVLAWAPDSRLLLAAGLLLASAWMLRRPWEGKARTDAPDP
jgi:hypothetical protein